MTLWNSARRTVLGAAGAGLALAAVVATSGSASATIRTGHIELCSNGNYASYLKWYDEDYQPQGRSATVARGTCQTFEVPAHNILAELYGVRNTHPHQSFFAGGTDVSTDSPATLLRATGTPPTRRSRCRRGAPTPRRPRPYCAQAAATPSTASRRGTLFTGDLTEESVSGHKPTPAGTGRHTSPSHNQPGHTSHRRPV